jgi:hypothetical protein
MREYLCHPVAVPPGPNYLSVFASFIISEGAVCILRDWVETGWGHRQLLHEVETV